MRPTKKTSLAQPKTHDSTSVEYHDAMTKLSFAVLVFELCTRSSYSTTENTVSPHVDYS